MSNRFFTKRILHMALGLHSRQLIFLYLLSFDSNTASQKIGNNQKPIILVNRLSVTIRGRELKF